MPRLAIVLSAIGSVESLEASLVSVLENRPADSEVIVVLNQPYADPYDLKEEVRFVAPAKRRSTIAGIHEALSLSRAPFVHLLSSGCLVSEGWADEALARFGDRQIGSVAPLVLDANDHDRVVAAGVNYRSSGRRVVNRSLESASLPRSIAAAGMFACFYRKAALDFVGGPSVQLGASQADVDLGFILSKAGFGVAFEPRSRVLALHELEARESAFRQALHDERLFWRNLPAKGRVGSLASHAALVSWELVTSLPRPRVVSQAIARMLGVCGWIGHARHRAALAQLEKRAVRPKEVRGQVRLDGAHTLVKGRGTKAATYPR